MKQWLLNWILKDITRFEVINHNSMNFEHGRCIVHNKKSRSFYSKWELSSQIQDEGKTLKIFT